jgi:TolB protein
VIFYTVPGLDSTEFRHIKPDGAADTLFATLPSNIAAVGLNSEVANRLVFAYQANSTAKFGIYRNSTVDIAGATTLVAPSYDFVDSLQVSSDGKFVYYIGSNGTSDSLFKVSIDGGTPTTLVASGALAAHVNQAGDAIVYSQLQTNNRAALFIQGVNAGDPATQLTEFSGTDGFDADYPQFSKGGNRIVFSSNRGGGITYDLWTIAAGGGDFKRVTNTTEADELGGSFNNDGSQVSFVKVSSIAEQTGIWRTNTSAVDSNTVFLNPIGAVGESTYWTSATGRSFAGSVFRLDRLNRKHRRRHR